ncbi:MoaD/ThiS family protein [Tsuneonella sp. HG222]
MADLAGAPTREFAAPLDWGSLLEGLDGDLADMVAGDRVKLAVGGTVVADKRTLMAGDGDEVALLPPVSGG